MVSVGLDLRELEVPERLYLTRKVVFLRPVTRTYKRAGRQEKGKNGEVEEEEERLDATA